MKCSFDDVPTEECGGIFKRVTKSRSARIHALPTDPTQRYSKISTFDL
jgi:hypothetical protein